MTREEVAKKIHWSTIFWFVGFINIGAMLPQLVKILRTHNVDGLAIGMFVIYFTTQVGFALEGYFGRHKALMVCMTISAAISASIICLIVHLR